MSFGSVLFHCFLWFSVIAMIGMFFLWVITSNMHYTWEVLKPGQAYSVSGRKYIFPNIDTQGATYLLKESHIAELREVLLRTSATLGSFDVNWWLTGGSLIGAVRHNAIPMPFDDDIDIAVEDTERRLLFGSAFQKRAAENDLRVIYLRGASSSKAERTGACVRLQLKGHFATLDIFFWKRFPEGLTPPTQSSLPTTTSQTTANDSPNDDSSEIELLAEDEDEDNMEEVKENEAEVKISEPVRKMVCKLDGWSPDGKVVINTKERFFEEDVFPTVRNKLVDSMLVNLPQNPPALLIQQYTKGVFEKVVARSTFVSHAFPFLVLGAMWTESPPG